MNGININRYQFEYDLTWMSFFQNHEGKTYLRFGGREDASPESHLSKDSLLSAMQLALKLHESNSVRDFSRYEPKGETKLTPGQIPSTKKILARRQNKCIHCHEVKGAKLRELRKEDALTKDMVFTYPSPAHLGIHLDTIKQNEIKKVDENSAAANAGLMAGDRILEMDRQPVYTFADATRVLELAPKSGSLTVAFSRKNNQQNVEVNLEDGWRTNGDASWRESGHIVGPNSGFWGVNLSDNQRKNANIKDDSMAIKVTAVFGQHARRAKIKHGDIVTAIDGRSDDWTIKKLQSHLHMNREWGDKISINVKRKRQPMVLNMTLPEKPKD